MSDLNSPVVHRLLTASHIAVGSLSVFIWDMLYNLRHDYDLVKTHRGDLTSAVYFLSRFTTFGFVLTATLMLVKPMSNCEGIKTASAIFYIFFISSTLLLSYFRICAVWNRCPKVMLGFGLLWASSIAGSFTVIRGLGMEPLSGQCLEKVLHGYLAASVVLPTLNHVIVFTAITVGLCRFSTTSILDIRAGVKLYIFGDTLPAFSKALLQTSQLCYMVAVICGITTLVWFYACDFDSRYRLALFPLYATTVNIMFSWVFRKAKLGIFTIIPHGNENSNTNAIGLRQIQRAPILGNAKDHEIHSISPSRLSSLQGSEGHHTEQFSYGPNYILDDNHAPPVKIEVEKIVEFQSDLNIAEKGS